LKSLALRLKSMPVELDVSIESISNLENMVSSSEIEIHLRASGV